MKWIVLSIGLSAMVMVAAACGGDSGGKSGNTTKKKADGVVRKEVPADYKDKTNPTPDAAAAGEALFKAQCSSCHGEKGDGDSPVGKALKPPAGDLTTAEFQDAVKDDYIFWHITVGGAAGPDGSGMTAFKDTLSEEQRWQVVAYVRSLKK